MNLRKPDIIARRKYFGIKRRNKMKDNIILLDIELATSS